jgi:hypothetical protein
MKTSQAEWANIRQQFIDRSAERGVSLTLRDRVWAVTSTGEWIALPGTSDSPIPDRWWLGCDPEKLRTRGPLGIVLLCQARGGRLHAIGLSGRRFWGFEAKLSKNGRQVFFNVVRRGERFLLQLRGGEEVDVTEGVDDISWIADGHRGETASGGVPSPSRHEPVPEQETKDTLEREVPPTAPTRFFAVVKDGALHPLDDVALEAGALHLVEIRGAPAVPGSRSLRRILARGGSTDLPPDFAEQHDHYAHGAARR